MFQWGSQQHYVALDALEIGIGNTICALGRVSDQVHRLKVDSFHTALNFTRWR